MSSLTSSSRHLRPEGVGSSRRRELLASCLVFALLFGCGADPAVVGPPADSLDMGADDFADAAPDGGDMPTVVPDMKVDVDMTNPPPEEDMKALVLEDMAPEEPVEATFSAAYDLDVPHAEGGVYDPVTHAFFVGSLVTGGVHRIDANSGEERQVYAEQRPGEWWTLGLGIDVERRWIWVCSMSDLREVGEGDPANLGYIVQFDLETEAAIRTYDLSQAFPGANCADVEPAADGKVYVADRAHPNIYVIDPETEQIELFATDEALGGDVVGQNGLLVLPDQSGLLAIVYLTPKLVHVSLTDGSVKEVEIDGDFFDFVPPLSGADGITWDGGSALVMFSSKLNKITPTSADWSSASSESIDTEPGMTDVIHTPGGNYILNGQPVTFALENEPEPTRLVRFDEVFD